MRTKKFFFAALTQPPRHRSDELPALVRAELLVEFEDLPPHRQVGLRFIADGADELLLLLQPHVLDRRQIRVVSGPGTLLPEVHFLFSGPLLSDIGSVGWRTILLESPLSLIRRAGELLFGLGDDGR